jgi:hypothetical protein
MNWQNRVAIGQLFSISCTPAGLIGALSASANLIVDWRVLRWKRLLPEQRGLGTQKAKGKC